MSLGELVVFVEAAFSCYPWEGTPQLVWLGCAKSTGETLSLVSAEVESADMAPSHQPLLGLIPRGEVAVPREELARILIDWLGTDASVEWWTWQPLPEEFEELGAPDGYWSDRASQMELDALREIIDPWPEAWGATARDLRAAVSTYPLLIEFPDPPTPYSPAGFAEWQRRVWLDWRGRAFPGGGVPIVVFYIPLAQPLPVPHGFIVKSMVERPSLSRVKKLGSLATEGVSLCVLQASDDLSPMASDMSLLFGTVAETLDSTSMREPIRAERTMTIAEAVVPLSRDIDLSASPDFHEFSEDFDQALSAVRRLQEAYASLVQEPVLITSLATLPAAVPMWLGRIEDAFRKPRRLSDWVFLVNRSAGSLSTAPPTMQGDRLAELAEALTVRSEAITFSSYTDLRREAWNQRHLHGNWRLAAIVAAISGEVLLDAIFMHLHWELGERPSAVAQYFGVDGMSHTRRVLSQYAPLIGGVWLEEGDGAVARYLTHVVRLRHRIVHGGHDPSLDEADLALDAMVSLELYIGDLLTSPRALNRFTRTAVLWCGQSGLERRGKLTRRVRKLMADTSEPNWRTTFERWRSFVDFADDRPIPGADGHRMHIYLLIWSDGELRWLVHDWDAAAATVLPFEELAVSGLTPEALDGSRRRAASVDGDVPVRAVMEHARYVRSQAAWIWLDDYEVLPELGIHLPVPTPGSTRAQSRGAGPFPFVPVP